MKKILFTALGVILCYSCSTEKINDEVDLATTQEEVLNGKTTTNGEKYGTATGKSATVTGQYGIFHDPDYQWAFVQNNIWAIDDGDWGVDYGQFVWYNNINSWGVQAYTTTGKYSYSGVKSYPGLVFGRHYNNVSSNNNGFPKKIKDINSNLYAKWKVRVENDGGSGAKYNASFDIWFDPSSSNNGTNEYEIMIWTMRKGQWPINENNDINKPWKSNVWVWNARYDVYKGSISNGQQKVLTFIQKTGYNGSRNGTRSIAAPLKNFIDKAVSWNWLSDENYITSIQAGFEICTAGVSDTSKANFVTDEFYLGI